MKYVGRKEEQKQLKQALEDEGINIILITGKTGSGKSRMLHDALLRLRREGFTTFAFIKNYFDKGKDDALDIALREQDDIVIVWDNVHEKDKQFVDNVIKRARDIFRHKNYKFILASRNDSHFENVKTIPLRDIEDTELVEECALIFGVELEVDPKKILEKSDGTPYYIISLFKIFKGRSIGDADVKMLPDSVIGLWQKTINESYELSNINNDDLNAFRSIGLSKHAQAKTNVTYEQIFEIYNNVFHGNIGTLDYSLDKLVKKMFVSYNGGMYNVHDSHIEALERIFPLTSIHIQDFLKIENNLENLEVLSNWALLKREYDIAYSIANHITVSFPNADIGWFQKGYCLAMQDRHEDAVEAFRRANVLKPRSMTFNNIGNSLFHLGRKDDAMEVIEYALRLDPSNEEAHYNRGLILAEQKNYKRAIAEYDAAIDLWPDFAEALNNKGLALLHLGRYDEAITEFKKALDAKPDLVQALNNIGMSHHEIGKYQEAIDAYKEALRLDPSNNTSFNSLVLLLLDLKRYDDVTEMYKRRIGREVTISEVLMAMGKMLAELEKYNRSLVMFDELIRLDPNDAYAHFNKGLVLFNLKRTEDSTQAFTRAIQIKPELILQLKKIVDRATKSTP